MKKSVRISVLAAVAVAALFFTGCTRQISSGKYTTDKVVMTYVSSPLNVPSIVEKNQERYKKAFSGLGLDFAYSDIDSGADQTAALASGDIHILNAVGGSSVIMAAANDSDIVVLSMYSRAPGAFALFSNDESINSPEDLKGLTVAGPKGTILHELLAAYLAQGGMTVDDVNFVTMDIPSAVAALEGGSVDVALVGGTAKYNYEKDGKHMITDGNGLIAATICTAASRKFADSNPEIIETFLDSQKELEKYLKENEDEALSITAQELDIDKSAVEDMYVLYDFSTDISDEDVDMLQQTSDFLYESGMIEREFDVSGLIYKSR
ncbi:MAG: NrtA/SsuA/CpmA family ABC transporter substrate-binding protein [Lachnospiraceae bacterium]|nr:NrtA/SsuA/CpmA family ABC transporter substrate-binding protein [Lachnospiraceae bacterium]